MDLVMNRYPGLPVTMDPGSGWSPGVPITMVPVQVLTYRYPGKPITIGYDKLVHTSLSLQHV